MTIMAGQDVYQASQYAPQSTQVWTDAAEAAAAHRPTMAASCSTGTPAAGLAWKVRGPPPASAVAAAASYEQQYQHHHQQQQQQQLQSSLASPAAATRISSSRRSDVAQAGLQHNQHQQPPACSPMLGRSVAGYRAVVTRTPVSPSGYALSGTPQLQQHHQHATHATPPQQPQQTAPGAAAAAALAALAVSSKIAAGAGRMQPPAPQHQQQQAYAARTYSPAPLAGSSSGRTSKLLWQVHAPPQAAAAIAVSAAAVAGDGRSPASSLQDTAAAAAGSSGLSKLKQLSTARFARRVLTPPTGVLAAAAYAGGGSGGGAGGPPGTWRPAPHQGAEGWGVTTLPDGHAAPAAAGNCISSAVQGWFGGLRGPSSGSRSSTGAAQHHQAAAATASPQMQQQQPLEYAAASSEESMLRVPCDSCGRCFAPSALQHHAGACARVFGGASKRQPFNTKARRLQGMGASGGGDGDGGAAAPAQLRRGRGGGGGAASSSAPLNARLAVSSAQQQRAKQKWRAQSEQLRRAMQAGRPAASGNGGTWGAYGSYGSAPAAAADEDDSRVPCPHCGRRFAELVAERHIPHCKETRARPSRLAARGGAQTHTRRPV